MARAGCRLCILKFLNLWKYFLNGQAISAIEEKVSNVVVGLLGGAREWLQDKWGMESGEGLYGEGLSGKAS